MFMNFPKLIRDKFNRMTPQQKIETLKRKEKQLAPNLRGLPSYIERIANVAEQVYPGRWDIDIGKFEFYPSNIWNKRYSIRSVYLVIHFPEFTITNSESYTHVIRDMYIRLKMEYSHEYDSFTVGTMFEGKRMSFTVPEVMSQYQHSHMSSSLYKVGCGALTYRGFCLGESQIRNVMEANKRRFNPGLFKLFLMQLEEYLNWESIEGGPYNYMKDIVGNGGLRNLSDTVIYDFYKKLKTYYEKNPEEMDLNFRLSLGKIRVQQSDENYEDFFKIYGDDRRKYPPGAIVERRANGNYVSVVNIPEKVPSNYLDDLDKLWDSKPMYFQGKKIEYQLIHEKKEEKKEQGEFFIHPEIKRYVIQKIESNIYKEKHRNSAFIKYHTSGDTNRGFKEDTVFMPQN